MKVLVCSDSEILRAVAVHSLVSEGHDVVADERPEPLVDEAAGAGALLVSPLVAKSAIRLLRDRGFEGRALLFGDDPQEQLEERVAESGADGAVAASPLEGFGSRFVDALNRRRRVLIVDDSELAAQLLGAELAPKGFEIHYASNAEEATRLILKRPTRPDLILLDINMPDVDGAQFCRFLKQNQLFRGIKVVLCSGQEKEKVEEAARSCGADGFILKDEFLGRWVSEQVG